MTTLYPTKLHDKAVCVSKNEKCCTKTAFIKKNVAHVQHFYLFADRGLEHARRSEAAPMDVGIFVLKNGGDRTKMRSWQRRANYTIVETGTNSCRPLSRSSISNRPIRFGPT